MSSTSDVAPTVTRGWLIGAAAVAAAVVLGLVFVLWPSGSADGTQQSGSAAAPTASGSQAPAPPKNTAAACPALPEGPPQIPESLGGEWKDVGTMMAAPQSPKTYGPARIGRDKSTTCFAHSGAGALYAAANFIAGVGDPGVARAQARAMVAPGPGREAFVKSLKSGRPDNSIGHGNVSGHRLISYSGKAARVSVAFTFAEKDTYVAADVDLVWHLGDWKVVTNPDGSTPSGEPQVVPSLDGFTPWLPIDY